MLDSSRAGGRKAQTQVVTSTRHHSSKPPRIELSNSAKRQAGTQLALDLPVPGPGSREPEVRLRPSARARHLQIKVSPWQGVEVIVPKRRSAREVERFLASHREWIRKAWEKLLREYPEAGALRLPEVIAIPVANEVWRVRYGEWAAVRGHDGELRVPHDGDERATALKLQEWMKKKARDILPPRLARWSERTGLYPDKVAIRGQATRWGSCSTRNTISLNFRLLFLDPREIDCLLLHETCHLKHLNHGKRFWALMEKHMAGAKQRDRELGEGWKLVPPWALVK